MRRVRQLGMFQGYELDVPEASTDALPAAPWPWDNYVPDTPRDTYDPLSDPLNDPFPEELR